MNGAIGSLVETNWFDPSIDEDITADTVEGKRVASDASVTIFPISPMS